MNSIRSRIEKLETNPLEVLPFLLALRGDDAQILRDEAYKLKVQSLGKIVYFRGIIELSNICAKNCFYCGIRKDNPEVIRYFLSDEEVMRAAQFAFDSGYGSIVLQGGERSDTPFVHRIDRLLQLIHTQFQGKLGVTLSLGEQTPETYARWFHFGAHRYLLRIETTLPEHYATLHPQDGHHSYEARLRALQSLREGGWQTGSGILIGYPNQSYEAFAQDLYFLKTFDVDMVGMGPFLPHHQTPMAHWPEYDSSVQLDKGLNAIACMRLMQPRINIASSTALQALHPRGRELGILSGANIIMPNITDTHYRESYQLYDGKPSLNENAEDSRRALDESIRRTGETVGYNLWGDSLHFFDSKPSL